jgi:hypothetical protein
MTVAEYMRAANPVPEVFEEPPEELLRSILATERRREIPRPVLVLAAVVLAALLAAPAWALGRALYDLFEGEPAPPSVQRVVDEFRRYGHANVVASETRKLHEIEVSTGELATIWVAPTHGGGLCIAIFLGGLPAGSPGCQATQTLDPRAGALVAWTLQRHDPAGRVAVALLWGRTSDAVRRVELRYPDGTRVDVPLVKGFYLRELEREGQRPTLVLAFDAGDQEIGRRTVPGALSIHEDPSFEELYERARLVARSMNVTVVVTAARPGESCPERWLLVAAAGGDLAAECLGPLHHPAWARLNTPGRFDEQKRQWTTDFAYVLGGVDPPGKRVELRFEDGTSTRLRLRQGFFLWEVPRDRWQDDRRPKEIVVFDSAGREVARRDIDTRMLDGPQPIP